MRSGCGEIDTSSAGSAYEEHTDERTGDRYDAGDDHCSVRTLNRLSLARRRGSEVSTLRRRKDDVVLGIVERWRKSKSRHERGSCSRVGYAGAIVRGPASAREQFRVSRHP
jgi:hypothetical protein